jgi:hypothetical protein
MLAVCQYVRYSTAADVWSASFRDKKSWKITCTISYEQKPAPTAPPPSRSRCTVFTTCGFGWACRGSNLLLLTAAWKTKWRPRWMTVAWVINATQQGVKESLPHGDSAYTSPPSRYFSTSPHFVSQSLPLTFQLKKQYHEILNLYTFFIN